MCSNLTWINKSLIINKKLHAFFLFCGHVCNIKSLKHNVIWQFDLITKALSLHFCLLWFYYGTKVHIRGKSSMWEFVLSSYWLSHSWFLPTKKKIKLFDTSPAQFCHLLVRFPNEYENIEKEDKYPEIQWSAKIRYQAYLEFLGKEDRL